MKAKQKRTILCAEDDTSDLFFLQHALATVGLDATLKHVPDGEKAIHYLAGDSEFGDREQNPFPCVLLLDLHMPRMSGFEVLSWIREQAPSQVKEIPVVVLSSSDLELDKDKALALGAREYLVKPLELGRYRHVCERLRGYLPSGD